MKIVIPMAGWGSRLRPHTLTIPKPMVKIAGKPIVQRLAENLVQSVDGEVESIHFIIREEFGKETEQKLLEVAKSLNTKGIISYQDEPLGTAHAIYCAKESLEGNVIVAFADTLFKSNFKIDATKDGVIWVNKVEDPSAFGVVKLDKDHVITDFIEKPKEFITDLAIIGIYYFKDGAALSKEIKYLLDNDIKDKGEYQLTDALENLKSKGAKFIPGEVEEWLDCGNKNACIYTNERILEIVKDEENLSFTNQIEDCVIIEPCFFGKNVKIKNSIVGPHVSIGENTVIENAIIKNSIVQENCFIKNSVMNEGMLGNQVKLVKQGEDFSLGDYSTVL